MKTINKIYQIVGALGLALTLGNANAGVACGDIANEVFCNGDPTYDGAVELYGDVLFADDFFVDGHTVLTDGHFHTLEYGANAGAWTGQVIYVIYDDAGGVPGVPVSIGAVTEAAGEVTKVNLGTPDVLVGTDLVEYSYNFDLVDPLKLNKGTYWFALFLDSLEVFWVKSDGEFGASYVQGPTSGFGPWSSGTYNMTFALTGYVPEPGTLMLMLLGVAGVFAGRRVRQPLA